MPKKSSYLYQIILAIVFGFTAVLGVLLFIQPDAIFPDASWGFQVMRSMQMGSAFNMLTKPSPQNLALNVSEFIAWWSPGQYLVPYSFKTLFHVNQGHAAALTVAIGQLIGLAGFYAFFKRAGFGSIISALSLVVIVCQQAFFTPYIFYNGGETLLFAFIGWFLYGCLTFNKTGFKLVLFVLLTGWIGFICKSSFMWMFAAGLLFIWISLSENEKNIKGWILKGFWLGIPAVISLAVIYMLYLSKGANPSSSSNGFGLKWETFAFPIASPLLAGFSADDLANGLLFHNDAPVFGYQAAVAIVVLLAVLSVWLMWAIWKQVPGKNYRAVLLSFYGFAIVFFCWQYLRMADISYESRHFRVIGLLVTPGALYVFSRLAVAYRAALALVIVFIAFFSIRFYTLSYKALKTETAYGSSGIAQQFIDQPSLNYITMLDKKNINAIFVFFSADLGLEIMHNRFITLDRLNPDISINFDDYVHKGHAGPLYILMPSNYMGVRASVIMKSFPGYKGFSLKELSDDYILYFATEAR